MKLELLTDKIFTRAKLRMEGKSNITIHEIPGLALQQNESLLCYGDQGDGYYLDYMFEGTGLECSITKNKFTCCEYTNDINVLSFNINELSTDITEEEYFQLCTVHDYGTITFEQIRHIVDIRDMIVAQHHNFRPRLGI